MLSYFPRPLHYKHQYNKSSFIKIGLALSVISVSTFELKYRNNRSEFDDLIVDYRESNAPNEVTKLGNRLDILDDRLKSDALFRNLSLFTLISTYLYNVIDGIYTKPTMGYRNKKPLHFYFDSEDFSAIRGTVKFSIPAQ